MAAAITSYTNTVQYCKLFYNNWYTITVIDQIPSKYKASILNHCEFMQELMQMCH